MSRAAGDFPRRQPAIVGVLRVEIAHFRGSRACAQWRHGDCSVRAHADARSRCPAVLPSAFGRSRVSHPRRIPRDARSVGDPGPGRPALARRSAPLPRGPGGADERRVPPPHPRLLRPRRVRASGVKAGTLNRDTQWGHSVLSVPVPQVLRNGSRTRHPRSEGRSFCVHHVRTLQELTTGDTQD